MIRFLSVIFLIGCGNELRFPPPLPDEVFCIETDTGTDEFCCPEFAENESECWVESTHS